MIISCQALILQDMTNKCSELIKVSQARLLTARCDPNHTHRCICMQTYILVAKRLEGVKPKLSSVVISGLRAKRGGHLFVLLSPKFTTIDQDFYNQGKELLCR